VKQTERCPYCGARDIIKKGVRKNKYGAVQLSLVEWTWSCLLSSGWEKESGTALWKELRRNVLRQAANSENYAKSRN
jgi:hypothetical protein